MGLDEREEQLHAPSASISVPAGKLQVGTRIVWEELQYPSRALRKFACRLAVPNPGAAGVLAYPTHCARSAGLPDLRVYDH
jgi:hypothetical protein